MKHLSAQPSIKKSSLKQILQCLFKARPKKTIHPVLFSLLALPNDIIVYLAHHLSYDSLFNLIRTNRRLNHLLIIPLYRRFLINNVHLNVVDTLMCHSLCLNKGTVRNLLNVGAPLHVLKGSTNKTSVLLAAASVDDADIIRMIASAAQPTPTMTKKNAPKIVFKVFLNSVVKPWQVDRCGRTMLHHICLDTRARSIAGNRFERGALSRERAFARTMVEEIIKYHDVDINARDFDGCTPLHYAAQSNWNYMIRLLVSLGAHVNATNGSGATALHLAARGQDINAALSACRTLVRLGADKSIEVPSSGRTARDSAVARNSEGLGSFKRRIVNRLVDLLECR